MSTSASLYSRLQSARNAHDRVQHDYQQRQSALQQTQASMANTLQRIRTVIIEAIRDGERFDWTDTDEQVSALFKQLYARHDELAEQLKRDDHAAASANERVKQALARQEQAELALDHLDEHIDKATEALPAVQALRQQADEIELLTERLKNQKADADAEASNKRQAYEADRYFRYLWQRSYGSDRYAAGAISQRFDRWLAESCYYSDNARQYQLLLAIPERLQAAVTESSSQLAALDEQIAEQRARIAEQMQRAAAQKALDDASAEVAAAKASVTEIVARINASKAETGTIQTGGHDLHQRMASVVDHALDNQQLKRFVSATMTNVDDKLLQQYDGQYRQQQQLQADLSSLSVSLQSLLNDMAELNSAYNRAKTLEAAAVAAAAARRSNRSGGGMWGGGMGGLGGGGLGGGGFGGGGFSSGGGFGGGGFRTGGGF